MDQIQWRDRAGFSPASPFALLIEIYGVVQTSVTLQMMSLFTSTIAPVSRITSNPALLNHADYIIHLFEIGAKTIRRQRRTSHSESASGF
jgi:hypothetical protein